MKITDVVTDRFSYRSRIVKDSEGHTHPGQEHEATATLTRIQTDEGVEGYCFGGSPSVMENLVKPIVVGKDPFYREAIWQELHRNQRSYAALSDGQLAVVDMALWDLAGRAVQRPVYHLLGATRDKVPAYGSTMCGDDLEGGLDTPEAYADFADWLVNERGYPAVKLHAWMPPMPGAPDVKRDVAACAAVRERVGPDVDLMLDPCHHYTRLEARYLARALEELDYLWMEEPMPEYSTSSYIWLKGETDLTIVGPETADGKLFTRAEWIRQGASDVTRGGVGRTGGITGLMKIAHLAEAFHMDLEIHGGGPGNLSVLCAMGIQGRYYERGLLHPFLDHEEPRPWLHALTDPMDDEGYVHIAQEPGLGWQINFDYIDAHRVG